MTETGALWGIELGGTKIEAAIVDAAHPERAVARSRAATESEHGYDHIIGRVCALVADLEASTGRARASVIGVATPGTAEPTTGALRNSNTVSLNGRPLARDLSSALGAEVRIANDANCFALAEATLGAARGHAVVLGLILGTGVGSGIVVHGRVLQGPHGIAGEWGHNPLGGETTPCYCGRAGCVETVISGPALERFYHARSGERAALPEIVRRARAGDHHADAAMCRLVEKFGAAIAAVVNVLDPAAIVIGGGVGNIDRLYGAEARTAIERHLFNPELRTPLLRPALGDSAGVFGAALLAR